MMRRALALLGVLTSAAIAHPVAQGSLALDVLPDHLKARLRVSNEEVFVAGAFGKDAPPTTSIDQLWQAHGEYLLQHVHVIADGHSLSGRVERVETPDDKTTAGYATYELRFDLPATRPREIIVRQDVLNEIEFAPGNPWEATFIVRLSIDGRVVNENQLLTRKAPFVLPLDAGARQSASGSAFFSYLRHGVDHILSGWDHLLFIAALVLAATSLWELVKVITAFTVAHTLTLSLSVLDIFRLPSRIVEPMIALSIVVVATQNVLWPQQRRGRGRLLAAFGFGLFHGLGFAGGLLEAMQGSPGVGVALAGFSLGVEIGHQVVVLPVFAAMKLLGKTGRSGSIRASILRYGSSTIAIAGMIYFVAALRS